MLVDAQDARLADVAAPPGTPQSPPARLGKDKEPWDVLLVEERAAAEKLGWTPESWEHGDPPVCSSAWETLDAEQRAAATALGYERVIWDEEAAASDLELLELLGAFPLLELPEEMQLLVAAHVFSPRDRAALCVAVPPLGRKAIKQIPAYTGPLMSLGKRVLSGGAASEAEVRQYVREFEPSEAAHPLLALNEYAQLNTMAAPGARVRYVTEGNTLEWRLESGALLRVWMPRSNRNGDPGELAMMYHYKGKRGAERLVSINDWSSGLVRYYEGKAGAEHLVCIKGIPSLGGVVTYFKGKSGAEHKVRQELPTGAVHYYEGKAGAEHLVRIKGIPSLGGVVTYFEGKRGAEHYAPKVFSLVGMSASEVRGLLGEVRPSSTWYFPS